MQREDEESTEQGKEFSKKEKYYKTDDGLLTQKYLENQEPKHNHVEVGWY